MKLIVLVAGVPAAGKTYFANVLSRETKLPLICKDKIKEVMWESIKWDNTVRTESRKYGNVAYDLSLLFTENLMKSGNSLIFESNFHPTYVDVLKPLIEKYDYKVVTILLDGDLKILHKRFLDRDKSAERHEGLVSNYFQDYKTFEECVASLREFSIGEKLIIDTTILNEIDYTNAIMAVKDLIKQ